MASTTNVVLVKLLDGYTYMSVIVKLPFKNINRWI